MEEINNRLNDYTGEEEEEEELGLVRSENSIGGSLNDSTAELVQ